MSIEIWQKEDPYDWLGESYRTALPLANTPGAFKRTVKTATITRLKSIWTNSVR